MIVILEGPDGAGKTSLAQEIAAIIDAEIHHEGPPQTEELLQHYATLLDDAFRTQEDVVFDRLHLGEAVYGPLMRGRSRIDELGMELLVKQIKTVGAVTVYCWPPFDRAFYNWKARHKTEYVPDENIYRRVYDAYHTLMQLYPPDFFWDYTKDSEPDLLQKIFNQLPVPYLPGYLGPSNPKVVFVGETANHPTLDLPFFSQDNSSQYFYKGMYAAGWRMSEFGAINAQRPGNVLRMDLKDILEKLRPAVICCLGQRAEKELQKANVRFGEIVRIPHPAYWKRFHARESDAYVYWLREVRDLVHSKQPDIRPVQPGLGPAS